MAATVLLRHDTPDGSAHWDWMIQRLGGGLTTFRVAVRIDLGPACFGAERLPDHREAYLTYEGPVTGDRGSVRRVADGTVVVELDRPDRFIVLGSLGPVRGRFAGSRGPDGFWRFAFISEKLEPGA
ncbi:MAG: hypothetical protein IT437_00960 [Phycisphaerales bacterium]|nr:hypothetical protein [Phycisphaerales bacterium]